MSQEFGNQGNSFGLILWGSAIKRKSLFIVFSPEVSLTAFGPLRPLFRFCSIPPLRLFFSDIFYTKSFSLFTYRTIYSIFPNTPYGKISTHQIYGMILYFTLFLYSAYPFNSFSRTASSFLILFAIITGYARKTTKDIIEPSTKGAERNKRIVTPYIGWRTIPYNPVSTTFCPLRRLLPLAISRCFLLILLHKAYMKKEIRHTDP